jgi:hypothetical protein
MLIVGSLAERYSKLNPLEPVVGGVAFVIVLGGV